MGFGRRSSTCAERSGSSGFSLLELLVALFATSVLAAILSSFVYSSVRWRSEVGQRIETHQGLQSAVDAVVRDVRLAGACLPTSGQLRALNGANAAGADRILVRIGLLEDNQACIRTVLSTAVAAGDDTLPVDFVDGFAADVRLGVVHPNGTFEIATVQTVGTAPPEIVLSGGLTADYPEGSGVYALTEREWQLDTTNALDPVLTLSIDGAAPMPFVTGLGRFDLRYVLERNCPTCDVVDLPANPGEWRLVKLVEVDVEAHAPSSQRTYSLAAVVRAKPRNLIP